MAQGWEVQRYHPETQHPETLLDIALRKPIDWAYEALSLGITHLPGAKELKPLIDADTSLSFRDQTEKIWDVKLTRAMHNKHDVVYIWMTTQLGGKEYFSWGLITDPDIDHIKGVSWMYDRFPTVRHSSEILPEPIGFADAKQVFFPH